MSAIVWWEVETPHVDAFQRFHGELWGWRFRPAFPIGGLQRALTSEPTRAGTRLYLEVDDLEATLERAVELGAEVERGRTALGGDDRWFATVLDPAGISIGLWTANPG